MIAAYGFQERWRETLGSGQKRMTIRATRKDGRLPRVGDTLRGYIGMRTKRCELVTEGIVTKVRLVTMRRTQLRGDVRVSIGARRIFTDELLQLAHADGFTGLGDFAAWFLPVGRDEFEGHIIEWRKR